MSKPIISVIIPTANRDFYLQQTLGTLLLQDFNRSEFEILIIDNASTDDTKKIAHECIKENPLYNIRYYYEPIPGLLSGRHRGAKEAKAEILVYIDDDILADKEWLSSIYKTFDAEDVHLVGGKNLPKYEIDPPEWLKWFWLENKDGKFCGYLSLSDMGEVEKPINACMVWGLNYAIRKKSLYNLGGFFPDSMPPKLQYLQGNGESGLSLKANAMNYKAVYQPKALVYHQVPAERLTYEYFDKRNYFEGVCDSYRDLRDKHLFNIDKKKWWEPQSSWAYLKLPLKPLKKLIYPVLYSLGFKNYKLIEDLSEEHKLKLRFNKKFREGYEFHAANVKKSPELLKWVLKKDYWDYELPKLNNL